MEILKYKALMKLIGASHISLLTSKKKGNWRKSHQTTFIQTQQGLEEMLHVR